jgi:DNA repair exonuclease SbcCD ATPase subunit
MFKCQFCSKSFSTQTNLVKHQNKTQKCIRLQKNSKENEMKELITKLQTENSVLENEMKELITKLQTENEMKELITKLQTENKVLKNEIELLQNEVQTAQNEIQTLQNEIQTSHDLNKQLHSAQLEIKELNIQLQSENKVLQKHQDIVFKMVQEPKISNKINNKINITNNLTVYDPNLIKDRFTTVINDVEASDLYDGQKAISRLVAPCLKNDDGTKMMQCSDYSRNVFIMKDNDGNIVKDINCRNLCNIIEPIANKKAHQLLKEDFDERCKVHEFKKLENSMTERKKKIESLRATSKGFRNTTNQFRDYMERINQEEKRIEQDLKQYNELKDSGVKHSGDCDMLDIKLSTAITDIQELKTNPSIFSKNLSQYV